MDFKFKSNKWVGNICNRFESICQDVDDFISKKTVKYVEDQVQNVSLNVTQFYSGVVEDILPMLEDNIKSEESAITDKKVHAEYSLNLTMGVKEKPVDMHEKALSVEQDSIDIQRNSNTLMPSELDLSGQCTTPLGEDPLEEEETDMPLEQDDDCEEETDMPLLQDDDCIISNNSDKVVFENTERDLMPSQSDDINHNNDMQDIDSSQAPLVDEVGFMALPEEGNLSKRFSDYTECNSDISSNGWECELNLPEVEESNFDDDRSSSLQPVILVDKSEKDVPLSDNFSTQDECLNGSSHVQSPEEADNKSEKDVSLSDRISTEDERLNGLSNVPSGEEADDKSEKDVSLIDSILTEHKCLNGSSHVQSCEEAVNKSEKDVSLIDSILTEDECLNRLSSVQSPEEADNSVISSGCSASSNLWELTFAKFVHTAEDTSTCRVSSVDCIDDKSDDFTNDVETPTTHGSVSLAGSSGVKGQTCSDISPSNTLISPTEYGSVGRVGGVISDPNMETVDLSNRVEHDGHGAIVNGNPSYRASCGGRNFRYYKNLIKDAFGSHKRITKEYEHLGILYGDIDEELWQHFEPSSLPSSLTSSSHLPRLPSHAASESDWELL